METITKARRIGGSLVVTLPKIVEEEEGIRDNQSVKINVKKIRRSGFGMFKGVAHFTKEDKFKDQLEK